MNRLLITEIGDSMRTEMKREYNRAKQQNQRVIRAALPDIRNSNQNPALFMDMEKGENPLYQKSQSDQALLNYMKVANLSLFGSPCKVKLENHIRDDLSIKKQKDYLNVCLEKYVNKILDDKTLMTKRKRDLLNELKRLEAKQKFKNYHHVETDMTQFSSIIEDTDRELKLMSIINSEGKLLQLQRRYEKKVQDDNKLKQQITMNYNKYKEGQIMHIEALPVLTHEDMEKDVEDIFQNKDLSSQRFHQRLTEKHVKEKQSIWKQHHFPSNHKRWLSK